MSEDMRQDFGRLEVKQPGLVVRPENTDQLAAALADLRARQLPYKLRGAAHSSGGQVLIEGGAVVALAGLDQIVADDPDSAEITVGGGASWLAISEHLRGHGRRPLGLTDQLRTTVAGTLSAGGFCDTSHRYGLQLGSVRRLQLVTPDGERHRLEPSDELFGFALGGLGQLGAITEATIETCTTKPLLAARTLRWYSVAAFVRDSIAITEGSLYDFVRARFVWSEGGTRAHVDATVGNFADALPATDPALASIAPTVAGNVELFDLLAELGRDQLAGWDWSTAALEMVLPLPDAVELWPELEARIVDAEIHKHFRRGAGAMVLPCRPRLPLAPLPSSDHCLVVALRPRATRDRARELIGPLRELAALALAAGGKIYMIGVENLTSDQLVLQYGPVLDRWLELKRELDPDHLCNPGLLPR